MPWPRCSRIDSRRSRGRALCVASLLLLAPGVCAQFDHATAILPAPTYLSVAIASSGADVEALFTTLHDGLRVQVEYRIRVAIPRDYPFRFLGDRVLREFNAPVEAHWDPFRSEYRIIHSTGLVTSHSDEAEFYTALFELDDFRIPWASIRRDVALVVETSVEYTPVVFVPGLSILSFLSSNRRETSNWSRHVLAPPSGTR